MKQNAMKLPQHKSKLKFTKHRDLSKISDNPFEKRTVHKLKHEVFNRTVKGAKRNVARARTEAAQRREKTLLVDYRRSKKANIFRDKRCRESDLSMLEEKNMRARIQKEKIMNGMNSKNSPYIAKENFDEEFKEAIPTHREIAGGMKYNFETTFPSDENATDGEVSQMLFVRDHTGNALNKPKNKILEKIEKKKAKKVEQNRLKEHQAELLSDLDARFHDLFGSLDQRPTQRRSDEVKPALDEFDRMTRELLFEAKAVATDRKKTPEEIALVDKEKLEKLEKERLLRMKFDYHDSENSLQNDTKKREINADNLHNQQHLESHDESHTQKNISAEKKVNDLSSEESSNFTDDESSSESVDSSEGNISRDSSSVSSTDKENILQPLINDKNVSRYSNEAEEHSEDRSAIVEKVIIPLVLPCPTSMKSFREMIEQYAPSADEINTIVGRIVQCNSVRLNKQNSDKMHSFYSILLERFIELGDQLNSTKKPTDEIQCQLNFLVQILFDLTQEMPSTATILWKNLLESMQKELDKELQMKAAGAPHHVAACWPSVGRRLLLKVLGDLFPVTDFRHPVLTPAVLLIGQYLSKCPLENACNLNAGIFLSAMMIQFTAESKRVSQEALSFLTGLLAHISPDMEKIVAMNSNNKSDFIATPSLLNVSYYWIRENASKFHDNESNFEHLKLSMLDGWTENDVVSDKHKISFSVSALRCVYSLVIIFMRELKECLGLPELVLPLQKVLSKIRPLDNPVLPEALQHLHSKTQELVDTSVNAVLSTREPLRWMVTKADPMKALTPKYAENYDFSKEFGLDAEEAQLRILKRQVKREKKGAIRELKLDAAYLEDVRTKERSEEIKERSEMLRANRTWLEREQATWNEQVGKKSLRKLISGGGSYIKKKPKVGRK